MWTTGRDEPEVTNRSERVRTPTLESTDLKVGSESRHPAISLTDSRAASSRRGPLLPLSRHPDKDNNAAERMIRGPVVNRKNARGSHNGDTARNAAVIWTVTGRTSLPTAFADSPESVG